MNQNDHPIGGLKLTLGYSPAMPAEMQEMLKASTKAQQGKPPILTRMNAARTQNKRQVIEYKGFNSAENAAVLALYDALVQEPHIRATRTVNIGLIVEKGFTAFESSLGKEAWDKVKKYYGIGCKPDTSCLGTEELKVHLANMRTIENACAYIDGYWDIIQALYECLDEYNPINGIDERHQILTGAKISVMAIEILCGDWFLRKQMKRKTENNSTKKLLPDWLPDYKLCHEKANLEKSYGPEDVIGVYEMLKPYGPKCIVVDMVMREIWCLHQRGLIEEVMCFCELTFVEKGTEWNIISNNVPNPYFTISKVMMLKKKVHPERSVRAMEAFILKPFIKKTSQTELWELHVILTSLFDKGGKALEEEISPIDGGYFYADNIRERTTIFCLRGRHLISGRLEAERILYFAQYVYFKNLELPYSEKNKDLRGPAGQVMIAITILQKLGCTKAFYAEKAMSLAQEVLKMDHIGILKNCLERLANNEPEKEIEEIVKELGITSVELERWGGEELTDWSNPESVTKWLIKWGTKKGYVVQNDPEQRKLISAILVDGNIDKIRALAMKELDEESFMQEIGFDLVFAEMYFARDQVDCDGLTEHLIKAAKQAKQKKKTAKSCTIKLYKYLVNNRLPCGPDMVVIHQNPVLKKFIN